MSTGHKTHKTIPTILKRATVRLTKMALPSHVSSNTQPSTSFKKKIARKQILYPRSKIDDTIKLINSETLYPSSSQEDKENQDTNSQDDCASTSTRTSQQNDEMPKIQNIRSIRETLSSNEKKIYNINTKQYNIVNRYGLFERGNQQGSRSPYQEFMILKKYLIDITSTNLCLIRFIQFEELDNMIYALRDRDQQMLIKTFFSHRFQKDQEYIDYFVKWSVMCQIINEHEVVMDINVFLSNTFFLAHADRIIELNKKILALEENACDQREQTKTIKQMLLLLFKEGHISSIKQQTEQLKKGEEINDESELFCRAMIKAIIQKEELDYSKWREFLHVYQKKVDIVNQKIKSCIDSFMSEKVWRARKTTIGGNTSIQLMI